MKHYNSSLLFDPSLTPQNAKGKGYDYLNDVIYDLLNPTVAMVDILEFSRKFHCKLGTPSSTTLDSHFGFYMPTKTNI